MRASIVSRVAALAAAAALAAGTAACGDGATSPNGSASAGPGAASSASEHNEADVMFSTMMIPHHEQAVEMAGLVPERTENAAVRDLAERIRAGQQPEIDRMSGWLREWGEPAAADLGGHGGHTGMSGMMSEDDVRDLEALEGPAFDRRWLEMMLEHHEGAVDMAEEVLRAGEHPGTAELARAVIEAQQREIAQMRALLAG